MKKSHRVAHENQRRGGFCCYHYTTLNSIVKNSFSKKYKFPLFPDVHICINPFASFIALLLSSFKLFYPILQFDATFFILLYCRFLCYLSQNIVSCPRNDAPLLSILHVCITHFFHIVSPNFKSDDKSNYTSRLLNNVCLFLILAIFLVLLL